MTVSLDTWMLQQEPFQRVLSSIARTGVVEDLDAFSSVSPVDPIDWNYALLAASSLTRATSESAQSAVLRVAQGAITSADTSEEQKHAAVVLLDRIGNQPAIKLAERREHIHQVLVKDMPLPMRLDIMRSRVELSIPMHDGPAIPVNRFQRDFWTAASGMQWLSVSAPTSAGKSFIVKKWFEDQLSVREQLHAVYLVPTRALIDEVSTDLLEHFGPQEESGVAIRTLPWSVEIGNTNREIFVITQERLHLIQGRLSWFAPQLIFVDEAQKFGDDARGILLQQTLDEAVRRNVDAQIVFASPLTQNPESLLDGAPSSASSGYIINEAVTVNQNLLWVNQVPRKPLVWTATLMAGDASSLVGEFELPARPSPESKRLPFVAVALGDRTGGNVVYVNTASSAEKTGQQIYDAVGDASDVSSDPEIASLVDLVRKTIHGNYGLATVLKRGVAFHYGNMPLLVRTEIERLFRRGKLKYLVCTSTLLEGVNLPCRNLFARGPQRGNGRIMSVGDFWNLAGRAGRWGTEFQGNIVCVDTSKETLWPDPPRSRVRQKLRRASEDVVADLPALRKYIQDGTPIRTGSQPMEYLYAFLACRTIQKVPVREVGWIGLSDADADALQMDIEASLEGIEIPAEIVLRHAGISPVSMQRLLNYMRQHPEQDQLGMTTPESSDAAESYVRALSRCERILGSSFGPEGRQWMIAILIASWMRGFPLKRLIEERIDYLRRSQEKDPTKRWTLASAIRSTMSDVENIVRFEAPKYLACYLDILEIHFRETGRHDDVEGLPDFTMMLELGVSRGTELSLMTLGLSRTSAITLSEFITADVLTPDECRAWIKSFDLVGAEFPQLVKDEIARVVGIETPN